MKARSLIYAALCALLITTGFASCSDDDDTPDWKNGAKTELAQTRAFILNEGSQKRNNSNIIYFDWKADTAFTSCIYTAQNGQKLGDTGNDITEYNGKLLVTVNGSNYVALLNGSGVELSRISFETYKNLGTVRSVAADDGYAYVSSYGGYLSKIKIDGNQLVYVDSVAVGNHPEGVAVEDDKIYCSVSGWGFDKRVACISENNFKSVSYIEVMSNPDNLVAEDDKIFVQGYSSLYDYPYGVIDTKTNTYTELGNASAISAANGKVYLALSLTNWSTYETSTSLAVYDIKTGKTDKDFFKNVPEDLTTESVYSISVNPYTGEIYVATSDFVSDGIVYKFKADGTYEKQFSAYGINPCKILFLK
jgi:hypothetical protein